MGQPVTTSEQLLAGICERLDRIVALLEPSTQSPADPQNQATIVSEPRVGQGRRTRARTKRAGSDASSPAPDPAE